MNPKDTPMTANEAVKQDFAPCPVCHQYSHGIGEGPVTDAFNHFQAMFSHRGDGIPTQPLFDDTTRDAAQVLMAEITRLASAAGQAVEVTQACSWCGANPVVTHLDGDDLCKPCADKWVRAEGQFQHEGNDDA